MSITRLLDSAIATVAPTWARHRLESRLALAAYDAAKRDRERGPNRGTRGSADDDLLPDLSQLRANARTAVRDDGTAAALLEVFVENVVGKGIVPQALIEAGEETGFSEQEARDWAAAAERVFWRWGWLTRSADATGLETFAGLQRQACTELIRDGEFLVHRQIPDGERYLPSGCQFIDVDRLRDPAKLPEGVNLRAGVEVNAACQPVAYWITPRHPSETHRPGLTAQERRNDPVRYSRYDGQLSLLHGFLRTRAGQRRGVPMFARCQRHIEALNDIVKSEATASRATARIAMVITQAAATLNPATMVQQNDGQWLQKIEPGTIPRLRPGEKIEGFAPNRPGTTWEPFVLNMLRIICSSFGMPRELVQKDFADMSFSGARVALMEARRRFEAFREVTFLPQFCQPWWEIAITEAVVTGKLPRPKNWDANRHAYLEALWTPPSWGYVDPKTDVEASALAVQSNLSTPQIEAAKAGLDWEQVLRDRAKHLRLALDLEQEFDLPKGTLSKGDPAPKPPAAVAPEPPGDNQDPPAAAPD